MSEWRITRLRGKYALTFERNGKRHRYSLGTDDARQAYLLAPAIYAEVTRTQGQKVADLWRDYLADKAGHAIVGTMTHTWKALKARFGDRDGESITIEDCRAHTAERRKRGISDGTIHTELGHLRMVLVWAEKHKLIGKAPHIERPKKPEPKDRFMTRDEARRMIEEARTPHLRLAFHLMLATAARVTAILELTWDRVDMTRRLIHLRDPNDTVRRKGRAIVPINATLFAALKDARDGAMTDYVVEWAGQPVKSLKKGIATAAEKAGLEGISAHVFRHTSAVWMAEAGVPMEEIAQYLGHKNANITRRVYAKYSPDHLRKAAEALEMGLYVVPPVTGEPIKENIK
ncbi:tyrosine-type recombinase/integrase [Brucella tritici]|uniref:tyrosine-type recombinase/integrase n=1 Tax=Brucella tritici TaxID=94626 RepID=UPI002000FA93|nr:site-specific integrase [Brucella tritici]